jgi:hypothetical protein
MGRQVGGRNGCPPHMRRISKNIKRTVFIKYSSFINIKKTNHKKAQKTQKAKQKTGGKDENSK